MLGLIALYGAHRQTLGRVKALERRLEHLGDAPERLDSTPAAPAPRPQSARVSAPQPREWIGDPTVSGAVAAPAASPEQEEQGAEGRGQQAKETLAGLFERLVGGRLLIWIGGVALAVAGVFLVRYSIEIGLVTPPVRMILAAAFGLLLVVAGEIARMRAGRAPDPRIAQALVGAGILVLYATAYGSHVLFGLIGLGTVAALMAAVTVAALALSLRHGAPTAVLGLAGGFAAPLLVGDPDAGAVPLIFYLGFLNAALFVVAQRRGWTWLAAGAVLLSFLWMGLPIVGPRDDALAAGLFIVALSLCAALVHPGQGRQLKLIQPVGIGLLQLAMLVARADLGVPAWALFGALSAGSMFLALRGPEYRLLPPLALALALLLLAVKALTATDPLTGYAAAAVTFLFAGFAFPRAAGAERLVWTATACAALAGPAAILRVGDPELLLRPGWGALMALLAIGPAALAWRQRGHASTDSKPDFPLLFASGSAALLLAFAAYDLVPPRILPAAWLGLALGAALCGRKVRDSSISISAIGLSALAVLWIIPMVGRLWQTIAGSIAGEPALAANLPGSLDAVLLLGAPAVLIVMLCPMLPVCYGRARAGSLAVAGIYLTGAAYILFKQMFGLSSQEDFVARGFAERTIVTQALFAAGWLIGSARIGALAPVRKPAAIALTALAATRFVWFDLIIHNPTLMTQQVGPMPLLNLLLPAYFGSALWLHLARRRDGALSGLWLTLFLVALIAGSGFTVRQIFQGSILTGETLPLAEFYCYSLAGLLVSIALLAAGVRLSDKPLRFAGLLLLTGTMLKVFIVDASALEGLLRILSFLGLGIALIGIGKLYGTVLKKAGSA